MSALGRLARLLHILCSLFLCACPTYSLNLTPATAPRRQLGSKRKAAAAATAATAAETAEGDDTGEDGDGSWERSWASHRVRSHARSAEAGANARITAALRPSGDGSLLSPQVVFLADGPALQRQHLAMSASRRGATPGVFMTSEPLNAALGAAGSTRVGLCQQAAAAAVAQPALVGGSRDQDGWEALLQRSLVSQAPPATPDLDRIMAWLEHNGGTAGCLLPGRGGSSKQVSWRMERNMCTVAPDAV